MEYSCEFEGERRERKRVISVVELGDGQLVYIRLEDARSMF